MKHKKQRKATKSRASSPKDADGAASVEHAGQEHLDDFLKQITKLAPWDAWATKLAARRNPPPLHKLIPSASECPLLWSTTENTPPATVQLIEQLYALRRRRHRGETPGDWSTVAGEWLEALETRPLTADLALEAIAWVHGLPRLAVRLPAAAWSRLVTQLVKLAAAATSDDSFEDLPAERLLLVQMVAGELPLALAYVFPKLEGCQDLRGPARSVLAGGLLGSLDGEGIPHARLKQLWRPLLACWTRCLYLDKRVGGKSLSQEARLQYEWLARQSLRFRRHNGTLVFSDESSPVDSRAGLMKSTLEIGGDRVDRDLFDIQRGLKNAADSEFDLPWAGEHSEWAELAVLRANWTAKSPYLALSFPQGTFDSEFAVGPRGVWRGHYLPELRVDGSPLDVEGEWEELCWSSDEDMDYIELEIRLTNDWRLQRQFLLARQDQFLFTADVVLGPRAGQLDYRLELPLDPDVTWEPDDETTEIHWMAEKSLACVHPLALSEWRMDSRHGKFDGRVLYQSASATGLYAPLFIDLNPKRSGKARTWRQLTVAQDLQLLPRDVAVGYRIQIGTRQWAIYRSLAPAASRTFLGQNLTSEFVIGRFDSDGELDNLIEIE